MRKLFSAVVVVAAVTGCSPTGAELQEKLKDLPGAGTGVDADKVDGKDSAAFAGADHRHAATDIDGKVASAAVADSANAVAWSNVSGKPETYTPAQHVHSALDITSGVLDAARLPYAQMIATGLCGALGKSDGAGAAVPFTTMTQTGSAVCGTAAQTIGTTCRSVVIVTGANEFKTGISCEAVAGSVASEAQTLFACCDGTPTPDTTVTWTNVSGKPADFASLVTGKVPSAALADVAASVTWENVSGKPSDFASLVTGKVPSATVADSASAVEWANVSGKPGDFASLVTGKVPSAAVADSASAVEWANVSGKPGDFASLVTGKVPSAAVADSANAVTWANVSGKPGECRANTARAGSSCIEPTSSVRAAASWRTAATTCAAARGFLCRVADLEVDPQWVSGGAWSDQVNAYDDGNGGTVMAGTVYDWDSNASAMVLSLKPVTDALPYRCCFPLWEH